MDINTMLTLLSFCWMCTSPVKTFTVMETINLSIFLSLSVSISFLPLTQTAALRLPALNIIEMVIRCQAALTSSWKLQRYCLHLQLISDRWKIWANDGAIRVMLKAALVKWCSGSAALLTNEEVTSSHSFHSCYRKMPLSTSSEEEDGKHPNI